MKRFASPAANTMMRAGLAALGAGMALTLSACGHADKASEAASADNVEIPAEEALSALPANAQPVADAETAAGSAESGQ